MRKGVTTNVTKLDTKKIIELAEHLKAKSADIQIALTLPGIDALTQLEPDELHSAIDLIMTYAFTEIRVGLGITDLPDNATPDYKKMTIFNKVDEFYEEAAGDCYFCSGSVDPNADEFGPETRLCLKCKMKLGNFVEALGIPAGNVFNGMHSRKVQKARMQIKGANVPSGQEEKLNVTWH